MSWKINFVYYFVYRGFVHQFQLQLRVHEPYQPASNHMHVRSESYNRKSFSIVVGNKWPLNCRVSSYNLHRSTLQCHQEFFSNFYKCSQNGYDTKVQKGEK